MDKDRIGAVVFVAFLAALTYMGLFAEGVKWTLLLWVVALGFWGESGRKKVPVGWKAQLLCFGERMDAVLGEGWHWTPFPFSLRSVDCRQRTVKLDPLSVVTDDNVSVSIDGAIVYKINELNQYLNINDADIKTGLDDMWDEVIRTTVRGKIFKDVLGMQVELAKAAKGTIEGYTSLNWGISILKIVVAGIKMSDDMKKDMELMQREVKQREGQQIELDFFKDAVGKLTAKPPLGPGLSDDQAVMQVRIAMGQLSPTVSTQNFGLDPGSAAMVATILAAIGAKKP